MTYCYSFDEERFSGDFETEAEAISEAFTGYQNARTVVWVGEVCDAIDYFSAARVGSDVFDMISEQLGEEVGEVAECFSMTNEQELKLGELVLQFIVNNGGFGCFGVKNVREVKREDWQREQERDTKTEDLFADAPKEPTHEQ